MNDPKGMLRGAGKGVRHIRIANPADVDEVYFKQLIRSATGHLNQMTERDRERKIMTLHPAGKQGVNISKDKYSIVKAAIEQSLRKHGEMTFKGLAEDVEHQLRDRFDGSITWYVTIVKLDLEAREQLERAPKSNPQRIRLAQ